MRGVLAITALCAAGCSAPDQVHLEHRGTLDVQARGIVVGDDGYDGVVGMRDWGMACDFTTSGGLGADYETGGEVTVVDGEPTDEGDDFIITTYVGVSDGFVNLIRPFDWPVQQDVAVDGVVTAEALPNGFIAVSEADGCVVEWYGDDGRPDNTVSLGDWDCENATLTADRDGGLVFVANGGAVLSTDGDRTEVLDTTAELVVWDDDAHVLYTSAVGSDSVTALERDGSWRWTSHVDGGVVAIEAMGALLGAGVIVDQPNGMGQFLVLDAETGAVRSDVATPSAAHDLTVSGDGSVLGLVLDWQVHWYDLSAESLSWL